MAFKFKKAYFVKLVERHRLPAAITGIVTISLFLTFINMSLYYSGETSFIDLSRPGLEKERQQLQAADKQTKEKFSNTGEVSSEVLTEFQQQYKKSRSTLDALGKYSDQGLSDASLRFSEPAQDLNASE